MAPSDKPDSPRHGPSRWARPLLRADELWTRFETGLVVTVLSLEVSSMSLWVFLKGFSTPADSESRGGIVFRAIAGAIALGLTAHFATKRRRDAVRIAATLAGIGIGVLAARAWATVGVSYFSNVLNWFQQASFLTLFGGLRGVGTRLTVFLALVGGSLATARGKHVVLDILTRLVRGRVRAALVVAGWLVAAVVSACAAWGFLDHVAIENFGARADHSARTKCAQIARQLREDWFITTTQLALDAKSISHIVRGEPYAEWLRGREWNGWIARSGFRERYGADAARGLEIPDDDFRAPLVVVPGRGEPRGELISAANLVFPFGLLVIAVRFVLRSLLVVAGQVSADPDDSDELISAPSMPKA